MADRQRQINIRVDRESHRVLEAARFLRGMRGLQDLLAPEVEEYARRLRQESDEIRELLEIQSRFGSEPESG